MQLKHGNLIRNTFFIIFTSVILIRVLANFSLFNYQISVILPLLFLPFGSFILLKIIISYSKKSVVKKNDFIYLLVLFFLVCIPLIQYLVYENMVDGQDRSSFSQMVVISSLAISWLFAGQCIGHFNNFNKINKYMIYLSMAIILALMLSSFKDGPFVDYYYLSSLRSDNIKIHHLSLTEPITFVIFILLALNYQRIKRISYILFFLFIFFSLGGRTAFFCAILTIIIYEFLRNKTINFFAVLMVLLILIIGFFSFTSFSENMFFNKLIFNQGIEEDASFQGRKEFLYDFFDDFLDQFLIGNPNSLIVRHNDLGTYAHNLLSVIQFYGIGLFIVILYALFYFFVKIKKSNLIKSNNDLDIFGILMLIYSFLSIITGKSVLFAPLWFMIGFWSTRLKNYKLNIT